ncbi:DUF2147 domain-containing protein [Hymenobacter guriensis]|nr:DUF2147 domain-containing protein [Hymenobacter guriensis]
MKKALFYMLLWLAAALPAAGQQFSPLGTWADDRGEAHVELYRCGAELCGRLVWLRSPNTPTGQLQTDLHNPDPARRTQPLLGLVIMQHFRYADDERWTEGSIYDPSNGRTYSCYLRMLQKDVLEVKGYIGFPFIGSAHRWKRVQ